MRSAALVLGRDSYGSGYDSGSGGGGCTCIERFGMSDLQGKAVMGVVVEDSKGCER